MKTSNTDILVIGAGIVGIATAYYIKQISPKTRVCIVDQLQPMTLTSAQSGENYRDWWPHPTMKRFIEHSIHLMEEFATQNKNRIHLTRRGYLLATRSADISTWVDEIESSFGDNNENLAKNTIRFHSKQSANTYAPSISNEWSSAPSGVDILQGSSLIQKHYPSLDPKLKNAIHIRNAGMLDSQQLGACMLEHFKANGGIKITGKIKSIVKNTAFSVELEGRKKPILANRIVNAAGPFINEIAKMLDLELPVTNVLQQKIAFPDVKNAIPRNFPFVIDLDPQEIDWEPQDKKLLEEDPQYSWLTKSLPGSIHCRPEGGDNSNWVKLGWAYNQSTTDALLQPDLDDYFPEIVLHGAARLNPTLKCYYDGLPRKMIHYGGYYTATKENWPLIGETNVEGFYINGAMSGFGTMAACAGGELCAQTIFNKSLPEYAQDLSLNRYSNQELMSSLEKFDRGIL